MTEELDFETYLIISPKKFEVYLLNKKNLKNIYRNVYQFENNQDYINYDLLNIFLDDNVFKIEKLIGKFLKNIYVIIENNQILNLGIGIKKKNYEKTIDKKYLESCISEVKDLFNENYKNNKIMHIILSRYIIDGMKYLTFNRDLEGNNISVEINFISISHSLIKEINNIMEKYQIRIVSYLDLEYIKGSFKENSAHISVMASRIRNGENEGEVTLVPKSHKKRGFFEKFFQLFS